MTSRVLRRIASWVALLAIVAVTFMPSLTGMLSGGAFATDVCSADAGQSPLPDGSHHGLDHCPYCALHADLALPLPPAADGAAVAVLFRDLPPAFLAAPRASSTWSTAQSRAPPAFA